MPTTKSGTLSAQDRKADLAEQDRLDAEAREAPAVSVLTDAGWVDTDAASGLVEHGAGAARERAEDGGSPPVAPERGAQ